MLLREKDRQTLQEIFTSADAPVEVWAYGSRVNGTAHNGSDLDLVIRSEDLKPLPWDTLADLKERIRESNIPILVELHDWSRLPSSFHANIVRQYEVIFDPSFGTVLPLCTH
ncbi:nucleotidyltransferase family protein [Dyadobacter luticola]|uniref:Nucleotidyltransferase domain-containing protein n=1 Tax=Dyadobacter luticola TaxID=1979387 RepID=A0A5R9L303_9BACT|nr:nucleotidyltransferase domain-containing protein [Dyadobacter luticola]TLV02739.1 nucleotidyltransferase domain-containing protein [Dyadobacter luticola]